MGEQRFPSLEGEAFAPTRDALHSYARVTGAWAASQRSKRKHWWHASLRPSLCGLTTGVVYGPTDYALELDLAGSQLHIRTRAKTVSEQLAGQPASEIAQRVREVLVDSGVDEQHAPDGDKVSDTAYPEYAPAQADRLHRAFASVAAAMEDLRAGMHEEQSPIQVWPHHFDLSMIWLPGFKIAGEDPADEEQSDKQMNFGFAPGDDSIPEPYFYVTAYPLPEALPKVDLPAGTTWRSDGFNGAVCLYSTVAAMQDPHGYLLGMWNGLLEAGREHLARED